MIQFPNDEAFKTWAAAWLDGEGSISYAKVKNRRNGTYIYIAIVNISNVCPDPLMIIQKRFGGNISAFQPKQKRTKLLYHYSISSKSAINFLQEIVDYLIVKRKRAEILIQHYKENKHRCCRGRGYSPQMWEEEERVRQLIQKLNARTPARRRALDLVMAKRKKRFWSDSEMKFLFRNKDKPIIELSTFLKRSPKSIRNKISNLGLIEDRKWTLEEINFLRLQYSNGSKESIIKIIKRPWGAIMSKACELHIKRTNWALKSGATRRLHNMGENIG